MWLRLIYVCVLMHWYVVHMHESRTFFIPFIIDENCVTAKMYQSSI